MTQAVDLGARRTTHLPIVKDCSSVEATQRHGVFPSSGHVVALCTTRCHYWHVVRRQLWLALPLWLHHFKQALLKTRQLRELPGFLSLRPCGSLQHLFCSQLLKPWCGSLCSSSTFVNPIFNSSCYLLWKWSVASSSNRINNLLFLLCVGVKSWALLAWSLISLSQRLCREAFHILNTMYGYTTASFSTLKFRSCDYGAKASDPLGRRWLTARTP